MIYRSLLNCVLIWSHISSYKNTFRYQFLGPALQNCNISLKVSNVKTLFQICQMLIFLLLINHELILRRNYFEVK
jgi:hypothetical protein